MPKFDIQAAIREADWYSENGSTALRPYWRKLLEFYRASLPKNPPAGRESAEKR